MELRVLGPLEVVAGEQIAAPKRGKQRTLLAYLLLHANRPVAVDRLIDALWGERPPATAAASLHNHVSGLRRLLGSERIETAGSTYLLRVAPDEVDAHRFEELVRIGDQVASGESLELLREALALWRGRPFVDVEDELFAQAEIARLEELRLAAIEQRIAAELELGESRTLVAELEALAREHPFREEIRAQLMLALYRSGRQADALDVYQQARRTLVDELGIEPGQPLQQLHRRILLQDAALDLEPPDVVKQAASAPEPQRETRKSVTVVVLSLDVAAADPEVHRDVRERSEALVRGAIERHAGSIEPGGGPGGMLAVFGIPELHEDDPVRALRAAVEARAALDSGASLRAGVATGGVIVGDAIAGRPLQDARELERRARAGEILLAPATHRLVRDAAECEPDGDAALRLLRLDATAPGVARRVDSPFVDRQEELLLLETAFAEAVGSSTCRLFTVCGEAGIGKSRLVAELVRTLGDDATVLSGQCLPYGDGITYWPVVEIVRTAAGIGDDDPDTARDRLAALVAGSNRDAVADRLAGLFGGGRAADGDEIAQAVRWLREELAATRPVVAIVDDLHDAEPTLLDLLESVAERSHGAPILLVGLARPELLDARPAWGAGLENATTVSLEAFDDHESGLLLATLPGGAELEPVLRDRVLAAAGGHPLFVEELLTMMREPSPTRQDDPLPLPPTVEALLATRLERLPRLERLVLECGSVEGEIFHTAALGRLVPELEPTVLAETLERLQERNLVRPAEAQLAAGEAYRVRHALVGEQAYAAVPKRRRADLHAAFAAWLEEVAAARLAEIEEILAFHLERAFRLWEELGALDEERDALGERAGRLLADAGRRAYERSDMPATTNLLGRAAALLPVGDGERLRLLIDFGEALRAGGEYARSESVLVEAVDRSAATGRHATEAHAELELLFLRMAAGTARDDELVAAAERLVADPVAAEDRVALAKALYLLGLWHWNRLDASRAADHFLRAREAADAAAAPRLRRRSQLGLALTFITGPMPVGAALDELAMLLETSSGDGMSEAELMTYRGALETMCGHFDEARGLFARAAEQLDDLGHRVLRVSYDFPVITELVAGDAEAAERIARDAFDTLAGLGERANATLVAAAHAESLQRLSRHEEAAAQLAFAEQIEPDALLVHASVRSTRAKVLARLGQAEEAVALARETVALLEPTDALVLKGNARLALAETLVVSGRLDEARAVADEARALFEAKGATALAAAVVV